MAVAFAAALAGATAVPAATPGDPLQRARVLDCAVARLRPLVGPDGVKRAWPDAGALPAALGGDGRTVVAGTLLSDEGLVADGFRHTLYVDHAAGTAYVVEDGGFAGLRRVFGPLPLPACDTARAPGR